MNALTSSSEKPLQVRLSLGSYETLFSVGKVVSPLARLVATMVAAALAYCVLGIAVTRISVPPLDFLLSYAAISCAVTVLAVAALANAINIIDGFNGLASMVAFMKFASLAYVAFQVHDPIVLSASLIMMGAVMGFFIWNFPTSLIFLGDGGAYFIGFMLGELSIMIVMRNRDVSAWYPVLLFMYPIFETCFSIYRKKFIRGMSPGIPDGVHLHILVYKRLMRWAVGARTARELTRRNSLTSPYLWLLCLIAVIRADLRVALCQHRPVQVAEMAGGAEETAWLMKSQQCAREVDLE
ncbi:glycosyl transferase family 4 [Burkholderia sp. BT03]|nr:glycosyl transferase family 4 [Burkholderia sp. BT03]SKC94014.1 Glycosyl transferase family 4 [Paraburkholderia hospita]